MECIFVHEFSPRPISNLKLIWSLGFYFCNTLGPVLAATNQQQTFHVVDSLPEQTFDVWSPDVAHWRENIALMLFFWCEYQQFYAHAVLARLRAQSEECKDKQQQSADGSRVYHVPPDVGLFRWLIAPHYTMEIGAYTMMLAVGAIYVDKILMTFFVLLNLTDRAIQSRRWYIEKFTINNVPPHRKILIPRIF
jgi:hypothetical protein